MLNVRNVDYSEKRLINQIVTIHVNTFSGFFLTFMGRGFLNEMYCSYCEHVNSGILVAEKDGKAVGFLAYSGDLSNLYKFMIKTRLLPFAWYSFGAFIRKPSSFLHIICAFLKPGEAKREHEYIELASIGVDPIEKSNGIGTTLIDKLKSQVDFSKYAYITLETDAENNDAAIHFYEKNGFVRERMYITAEGRKMFEYRFYN